MPNILLILWKKICIGTITLKDNGKIGYNIHIHAIDFARKQGLMKSIVVMNAEELAKLPDWIEDRTPTGVNIYEKFDYLKRNGGKTQTDYFSFM